MVGSASAYFVSAPTGAAALPAVCAPGQPLTYQGLSAFGIAGTTRGNMVFFGKDAFRGYGSTPFTVSAYRGNLYINGWLWPFQQPPPNRT